MLLEKAFLISSLFYPLSSPCQNKKAFFFLLYPSSEIKTLQCQPFMAFQFFTGFYVSQLISVRQNLTLSNTKFSRAINLGCFARQLCLHMVQGRNKYLKSQFVCAVICFSCLQRLPDVAYFELLL